MASHAGSFKSTGVMFRGLRAVPVDPNLDPPAGACFNCHKRGHKRLNCPEPQVSPLCYNCGRREVTLSSCPRCSTRHREYLARVREEEQQLKNKRKRAKRDNESALRKLAKAVRNLQIMDGGNSPGTKASDTANSRVERGSPFTPSPPPEAKPWSKRTRANSASRRYYFHLGRETPEGEHSRYSSRETVVAEDGFRESIIGQIGERTTDKTERNDGASEDMWASCEFDRVDGNNNTKRDANDNKPHSPSRRGAAEQTDSSAVWNRSMECNECTDDADVEQTASGGNWSTRSNLSASGVSGQNGATESFSHGNDVKNFLKLLQKMSNLPVTTQEVVVLQVVSERERLSNSDKHSISGQENIGSNDPSREYSDLVDAITYLPMETQSIVLSEVVAQREYLAKP